MTPFEKRAFLGALLFLRFVIYFVTCVLAWDWVAVPMGAPALSVWQVVAVATGIRVVAISPNRGATDRIELALMKNSWKGKDLLSALEYVGLTAPVTQEDQLRLYIALKAVLGFERRKLSLLEAQSDRYEETKRRILELGRDGDIGINRSVPA